MKKKKKKKGRKSGKKERGKESDRKLNNVRSGIKDTKICEQKVFGNVRLEMRRRKKIKRL